MNIGRMHREMLKRVVDISITCQRIQHIILSLFCIGIICSASPIPEKKQLRRQKRSNKEIIMQEEGLQ
eukprot:m.225967 g.225967  ORF g.225967 m.225967 type:complete len:68 (+) comp15963_c0_seq9:1791-1994(+)